MKWLAMVLMVAGLGACSTVPVGTDEVGWTPLPDAQALEGEWGGTDLSRITIAQDGKYGWERSTSCATPPCPTSWVSGTWRVVHGKLYLDPDAGDDEIVEFRFEDRQAILYVKDGVGERMYVRSK